MCAARETIKCVLQQVHSGGASIGIINFTDDIFSCN